MDITKLLPKRETRGFGWGILLSLIAILLIGTLVTLLFEKMPTNIYTYLLAYSVIVITMPIICFGEKFLDTIEPGFKGVPLFLEGRIKLWLFKEGLIWKLPKPLMGFMRVDVREKNQEMNGTVALTVDNIPVIVDLSFSTMVTDPYAYTWIDNADKAIKDLILREVRAFIIIEEAEKAPTAKDDLREAIKIAATAEMQGRDEEGGDIKRPWGMTVTRIFVTDIRLPKELESAHTKKRVEEALVIAKATTINALKNGIRELKKEKDLLEGVSNKEIANIVQTEYETATRIIVDGSDPLSRAAAILVSGKKELKEVVENEK